jgi:hypothetical protein
MHKPIRIIKDDARVRLTQQVNLTSAIRTALLTLPETFEERELFERIAGLSYAGDPRMILPFENRSKVANIVNAQTEQFKELYHRLVVGLPGIEWPLESTKIHQDLSPSIRAAHVRKLPSNLRTQIDRHFAQLAGPPKESDETAYWIRVGGDPTLPEVLKSGGLLFSTIITILMRVHNRGQIDSSLVVFHPVRKGSHHFRNGKQYAICHQQAGQVLAQWLECFPMIRNPPGPIRWLVNPIEPESPLVFSQYLRYTVATYFESIGFAGRDGYKAVYPFIMMIYCGENPYVSILENPLS